MKDLIIELMMLNEGVAATDKYVEMGQISKAHRDMLMEKDPTTSKKYMVWMVRSFINGKFGNLEIPRYDVIAKYNDLVTRNLTNKKNIESFLDLPDLEAEVESKQDVKSKGEVRKQIKVRGAKVVLNTDKVKVWELLSPEKGGKEAAQLLGKGTKWCTSAKENNQFEHYFDDLVRGIYIVIPKGELFKQYGKFCVVTQRGQELEVWNAADSHLSKESAKDIFGILGLEF